MQLRTSRSESLTALLSRFMTGLLGCRSPRLPARQSYHRSAITVHPSCFVFQSQHRCSQSTKPVSQAWARSRRGSLRPVQGSSMSVKANREHANGEHANGDDLLVVGPGVLGSYVGMLWQQQHSTGTVTGQTNSTTNHDRYYISIQLINKVRQQLSQVPVQIATNADSAQNEGRE